MVDRRSATIEVAVVDVSYLQEHLRVAHAEVRRLTEQNAELEARNTRNRAIFLGSWILFGLLVWWLS